MQQNYKNHSRLVPMYHFVLLSIIVFMLVLSIMDLVHFLKGAGQNVWYLPAMFIATAFALTLQFWYSRAFASKVQDRTIRMEENFRHYLLTGKPLSPEITMDQIIALRFAPDEEFLPLIEQVLKENLSNKQIKQKIQAWRADHHRA